MIDRRRILDHTMTLLAWLSAAAMLLLVASMIGYVVARGYSALSIDFLIEPPRDSMTKGGIMTPLIGTIQLVFFAMLFAIPVGVATGLYFAEYARNDGFTAVLRLAIRCLAGVPSVVFGLFGLSLFVILLRLGSSLLSASLTLACLTLPLIVTASEQAFLAVPEDYRFASYALGASKWQTIWKVILPTASPTVITGIILSVGRVAGETAPIMFTGAAFFTPGIARSIFSEVMALPYHIYVLATAGTAIEETRHIQYGTVLVLLLMVLGICSVGIYMRSRLRRRLRA
ncbi:MAG TPA: phosphate ABC transporter permease PtsA [Synergistaceae bacterium]|nr:phosphate ABC transporter permease PtsA [Synergistaceae bacterium]